MPGRLGLPRRLSACVASGGPLLPAGRISPFVRHRLSRLVAPGRTVATRRATARFGRIARRWAAPGVGAAPACAVASRALPRVAAAPFSASVARETHSRAAIFEKQGFVEGHDRYLGPEVLFDIVETVNEFFAG
jgi:hypothetical protein